MTDNPICKKCDKETVRANAGLYSDSPYWYCRNCKREVDRFGYGVFSKSDTYVGSDVKLNIGGEPCYNYDMDFNSSTDEDEEAAELSFYGIEAQHKDLLNTSRIDVYYFPESLKEAIQRSLGIPEDMHRPGTESDLISTPKFSDFYSFTKKDKS